MVTTEEKHIQLQQNNMCLYTRYILNRKYTANKKNGGNIPAIIDKRQYYVPIGCGRCIECKTKKARDWQVRLLEEIKTSKNGVFVTLTFSNESIKELTQGVYEKFKNSKYKPKGYNLDNEIAILGVRRFLERWRKKYNKSVKHWLVTELGHQGTENIHLHGIIWTDNPEDINKIWKYGFVWDSVSKNGWVGGDTVNYIIKYVNKLDTDHLYYRSEILNSKGIGSNYLKTFNAEQNKYNGKNTKEYYKTETGHKISLPIYYRNKIYSEEERQKLWSLKLNEKVRYVNKIKISTKINEDEFIKATEYWRTVNIKKGYGSSIIDKERLLYELEKRNELQMKRILDIKRKKEKVKTNVNEESVIKELPKINPSDAF